MFATSEYKTWADMKGRCYNKNHKKYKIWGGRGIIVCDRWKNSFIAFFADMGPKPFLKAQIDRVNNDLGYNPENCHWTACVKNNQNKSNNKLTMEKARAIRRQYKSGNILQKKLAWIYGVSEGLISHVVNQKTWKEISC